MLGISTSGDFLKACEKILSMILNLQNETLSRDLKFFLIWKNK